MYAPGHFRKKHTENIKNIIEIIKFLSIIKN